MQLLMHLACTLTLGVTAPQAPVDFEKSWSAVRSQITTRYYGRQSQKEKMEKLLDECAPLAKRAKSKEEFSKHVNAMIDAFGDSHFDFFTDSDQGYYAMKALFNPEGAPQMPHIDAWFKPSPQGYVVQMVLEGGSAAKAGIRKGDIIESINGSPFEPVNSFKNRAGQQATLSVKRGTGVNSYTVNVSQQDAVSMFLMGSRRSMRTLETQGKKIGYFHLWTMINDQFRNAVSGAVYGEFRTTDAMILDLRDGFGGRPEGFADPFFRPEVSLDWKFGPNAPTKQLFGYQRPLVVLINEGSRSAKEVLSYILKKSKRATLMGTRTAGHVLGTSPVMIEDWGVLEIPMVEVFTDGERLEGIGVQPDIEIKPEFDADGNDRFIQGALDHLAQVLKP